MTIPKERVKAQLVHVDPKTKEKTVIFTGLVIPTAKGYITNETLPVAEHPANEYRWERLQFKIETVYNGSDKS